ncbi:hypothetical protein N7492_008575 [Penicillium capsulatum]|uniref:C6 zinc finger domain protein n=1 Tax=Penicillium capsulatum TaxID=69766 RepID=A0A9W9LH83_9EURO|nr:hypothetical protein N7492_008575 [Penicillium capsulatum]
MDEGPQLHQRFNTHSRPAYTYTPESIDQRITPSLAAKSLGKQQPVIFGSFVLSAFTRWFGLNKYRVHVPWTVYVAQKMGQSPAFDAAVFCINSMYMGHTHDDTRLQRSSREVYSKALRLFGDRIRDADAMKSRESVSITIVLSLFEAYSRTDSDSWARHAAGTALLMSHRGPDAHLTGFDRCLYLSFRSFIVAEAFINGKRCIFERPEWQALIAQVRLEDMTSSRVDGPIALFIDLQDRIFSEVSMIPGFLLRARQLHTSNDPRQACRDLAADVAHNRHKLGTLAAQLRLAATVQGYGLAPDEGEAPFIGPIPSTFPQEFANSVLRGSDQCMLILRLLSEHLHSEEQRGAVSPGSDDDVQESDPLPFRIVSRLCRAEGKQDGSKNVPSANKWLDMVAASMGLEAFEIVTSAEASSDLPCAYKAHRSTVLELR